MMVILIKKSSDSQTKTKTKKKQTNKYRYIYIEYNTVVAICKHTLIKNIS